MTVLNETLKRLEVTEAAKRKHKKAVLDRKLAAKSKQALDRQWKLEHAEYII